MIFWEGKKVLVTGGSGFLGHHIVHHLQDLGARVTVTESRTTDLTKIDEALDAIRKSEPEFIFHAAADVGGIGYNRAVPADIFRNNTLMAVNILEAARICPVKKLVLIGSACAYPGHVDGLMSEDRFLEGPMHESVEVYGFSKRALYLGGKAYRKQYGVNSIFLLLTNLYGPFDKYGPEESHVVAALVRKFANAKRVGLPSLTCWGSGKPTREFMYAEDCAQAIVRAGEVYESSEPLNIGTGIGTTIEELATALAKLTGYKGKVLWDHSMPDGAMHKVLDVSKMEKTLGNLPITPLRDGLKKTLDWYSSRPEFLITKG